MPGIIQIDVPHAKLEELCRRWKVRELSLFGSAVRSDFGPQSDIDLLVTFEDQAGWSLLDFVKLRDELAVLLGRPVDLVEEKGLRNPYRKAAILNDKTVVYGPG